MEISLQHRVVLITGGTGGLGKSLVQVFSAHKAQVLFTYLSHEERARELERNGARGFRVDLSCRQSVKEFTERLSKDYSRLDGMINNAGISRDHVVTKLSEEEFDECIEVNLSSVFLMVKQLMPLLRKSELPKILNIASRVGLRGNFGQVAYAASKAGLIALTKTMAQELGRRKILVNALTPGYVMSDMTSILPEAIHEKAQKESCLGVISEADEVARFAAYLMSENVQKVSGQIFHYDTRKT